MIKQSVGIDTSSFETYLSGDAVFLGQVLGGDAHGGSGIGVGQSVPQTVPKIKSCSKLHTPPSVVPGRAQRGIAHVLGSAADHDLQLTQSYSNNNKSY